MDESNAIKYPFISTQETTKQFVSFTSPAPVREIKFPAQALVTQRREEDMMKNGLVLLFILSALSLSASSSTGGQPFSSLKPVAAPTPAPSRQPPVLDKSESVSKPEPAPAPTPGEPQEIDEEGTVRVSTQLVTVPVSVMDRDTRYIADLTREEFRIYEDGAEQELAFFASTEKPFTVVLMLDVSDSAIFRLDEVKEEAIAFTDQLRADDRAIVVAFDRQVNILTEATCDKEALRQAIRSVVVGKGTSLYNALDMTLKQVLSGVEGRKAIVLFTDGVDTSSMGATFESNLRDAAESDSLIYTVQYELSPEGKQYDAQSPGMHGAGTRVNEIGIVGRIQRINANKYLSLLPEKTGGKHFLAGTVQSLGKSFAAIAEELRHQYSLGYYPKTPTQTGQQRRIKVRVTRPRLIVRARTSYGLSPGENIAPAGKQK
jgi:VWFA-related protein